MQKSGFESESELSMFIYGCELDFGEFGFDWINMVIYCPCSHISLCFSCPKYIQWYTVCFNISFDLNNFGHIIWYDSYQNRSYLKLSGRTEKERPMRMKRTDTDRSKWRNTGAFESNDLAMKRTIRWNEKSWQL